MTHTSLLQFEVSEKVATLTFNSPTKRNALEPAMLGAALAAASAWARCASVMATPAGNAKMQPFCAPWVRKRSSILTVLPCRL